eukprot:TRINITY_DN35116_c0_g3_i1.p1 TRINITY_DN35116_c0_g3~~TRINITY_DN35116_c0_g3_i1.p1  ORF type:complete len:170 (+),score=23.18 TRINITY_DN35116_c0_g3_i1:23-511(+)
MFDSYDLRTDATTQSDHGVSAVSSGTDPISKVDSATQGVPPVVSVSVQTDPVPHLEQWSDVRSTMEQHMANFRAIYEKEIEKLQNTLAELRSGDGVCDDEHDRVPAVAASLASLESLPERINRWADVEAAVNDAIEPVVQDGKASAEVELVGCRGKKGKKKR